jgi:hypothetical protein
VQIGIKIEPISPAASVYYGILRLSSLLWGGGGENSMEYGLENILLKP